MIKEHRVFLQDLRSKIWLRDYIKSCGDHQLLSAYNNCSSALVQLRSEHTKIVYLYVIIQKGKMRVAPGCPTCSHTSLIATLNIKIIRPASNIS